MKFEVSDLLFAGFPKFAMRALSPEYGIEFFYEFGKDYYWDNEIACWGKRDLSIHGPCVAVNLANPEQTTYLEAFEATFTYAAKIKADFVVVHTNEEIGEDKEALKELVKQRLAEVIAMAEKHGVKVLIENVGLCCKNNVLFTYEDFLALFEQFPTADALLDTGHAHVNGWDLAKVVKDLGSRLKACHVHDNSGKGDEHLPVGQGTIAWESYFAAVKEYAPAATQVLEYSRGFANTASLEAHLQELKIQYGL